MIESTDKQRNNSGHANIKAHQYKPGQSGNLKGRHKGKTLEEDARDILGEEFEGITAQIGLLKKLRAI